MYYQISGSSNQRTYTTKNRNIGKRNEELGGRKLYRFRPPLDNRGKNNDHRSVVKKSRNKGNGWQHTKLRLKDGSLALRKQFLYDLPQCPRLADSFTDQKQHCNRYHTLIAKPFQHFFRSQNTCTKEQYNNREQYHARTHLVQNQSNYHAQQRQQYKQDFKRHTSRYFIWNVWFPL